MKRQIVFQATRRIHYDNTAKRISGCSKAAFYDSEKDVISFDVLSYGKLKKRSSRVQISPYGKVNLYVDESLAVEDVREIIRLLRDLIVDESGFGIELQPVKVLYSRTRPNASWLKDFVLALELPIRISPQRLQLIASSIKIAQKSRIIQPKR